MNASRIPRELDPEVERRVAVDLYNRVWTYLDQPERTASDASAMVHAAHASRHHWAAVGGPENLARGEWLCSRVYAVLGRDEPARHHAHECLRLCEEHGLTDWDLAVAYEALARAYAVAGDAEQARQWLAKGQASAADIREDDDREVVLADLATVPLP